MKTIYDGVMETFTDLACDLASDPPRSDDALHAALAAVGLPTDLVDLLRDEIESLEEFL